MGLAEKRAIKKIREEEVPAFANELKTSVGVEPELSIDWEAFSRFTDGPKMERVMKNHVLPSILGAFQAIAQDDLGREALQQSLKRIELVAVGYPGCTMNPDCTFSEGILTIPVDLDYPVYYGEAALRERIEPKL